MSVFQEKENEKCSENDLMGTGLTGLIFFVVVTNPWEHNVTILSMHNKTLKISSQQFNWPVTLTLINLNLCHSALGLPDFQKTFSHWGDLASSLFYLLSNLMAQFVQTPLPYHLCQPNSKQLLFRPFFIIKPK